jgi:hypothetical protein
MGRAAASRAVGDGQRPTVRQFPAHPVARRTRRGHVQRGDVARVALWIKRS